MIVPRPNQAVPPMMLPMYEKMGWWAQMKMNGTCSLITVRDGEVVDTRSRHDEPHKAWKLTEASARIWRRVPKGEWTFCAELIHSKGHSEGIRDTHYIHDVVLRDGKPLLGSTYRARSELLGQVFGTEVKDKTDWYWVLDENSWLVRNRLRGENFAKLFADLSRPEHEGLVLKNPDGQLWPTNKNDWAVKCRRSGKNLSF